MSEYHYFVSSPREWRTGEDIEKLVRQMKRENRFFNGCNCWIVPLPEKSSYKVESYAPKVDGVKYIGYYSYHTGWDFSHLISNDD